MEKIALLAADKRGLVAVDMVNPEEIHELSSYDTSGRAQGVTLTGIYAYVADDGGGLRVIDISDLKWVEIDFPDDLQKAQDEILPNLKA